MPKSNFREMCKEWVVGSSPTSGVTSENRLIGGFLVE